MIQITVLCGGALTLACLLRGRRPQATTAVLGGCCLAALILALIAWLPQSHWSLVAMPNEIFAKYIETDQRARDVRKQIPESQSEFESATAVASSSQQASENRARTSTGSRIASWLIAHVQGIDESVRSAERSRSVRATRMFAQGSAFFLVGLVLMTWLWLYGWLYMWMIIRHSKPLEDEFV